MVLKLYGYTHSTAAKIAAIVLYEKGIPFEFINLDLALGQHRTPEYLAIQPFGQVPCIVCIKCFLNAHPSSDRNVIPRTTTASSYTRVVPSLDISRRTTQEDLG